MLAPADGSAALVCAVDDISAARSTHTGEAGRREASPSGSEVANEAMGGA
jgi:hypothetical protein